MTGTWEKETGDLEGGRFWMGVVSVGGTMVYLSLLGNNTAFATKHMLNTNHESAAERKADRDITQASIQDQAEAMAKYLNFGGNAVSTNTVIEYGTDAELRSRVVKMAEAISAVAVGAGPGLTDVEVDFGVSCVTSLGNDNNSYAKAKIGVYKDNGDMVVVKHLGKGVA